MTPSPTPNPILDAAAAISAPVDIVSAIEQALNLPSIPTSVLYIVAVLGGIALMIFSGKFVAGWINEIKTPGQQDSAAGGKSEEDQSADNLQNQINHLPKNK